MPYANPSPPSSHAMTAPGAEPIAAIATAAGCGGIGIVRISGASLTPLIQALIRQDQVLPRVAQLRDWYDAQGRVIDRGIMLYFPAPASYTREDVLELQGHGNPLLLQNLLARCLELGARIARPGEFTERAFLNGQLDLAQAEAVADLIEADSSAALEAAQRSLSGGFSRQLEPLRDALLHCRARIEAEFDFPEEEDVPRLGYAAFIADIRALHTQMQALYAQVHQGALLREGAHVVLIGQPNVGKSSLMNALAGEERALVTEIPGTTRDALRERIVLAGIPLYLTDTAGLRDTADPIERLGIARSWEMVQQANLALVVVDSRLGIQARDAAILARLPVSLPRLFIHNKIDLLDGTPPRENADKVGFAQGTERIAEAKVFCSAQTGAGLNELRTAILHAIGWCPSEAGHFIARTRHLDALRETLNHLNEALAHTGDMETVTHELRDFPAELCAESLRLAQQTLGRITGETLTDDLLGEIFSRFCIGK